MSCARVPCRVLPLSLSLCCVRACTGVLHTYFLLAQTTHPPPRNCILRVESRWSYRARRKFEKAKERHGFRFFDYRRPPRELRLSENRDIFDELKLLQVGGGFALTRTGP